MVRETDPMNRPEFQRPGGTEREAPPAAGRMKEYHSSEEVRQEVEHTRSRLSDTLNVLEEKLAPRRLYDQVADLFRSSGTQSRIVETVRRNPVPTILLAAGATWLVIDILSEEKEEKEEYVERPSAGEPVSGPTLESTRQRISETAETAKEKVSETTESLRAKASETAGQIGEKTSGMMRSAKEKVSGMAESAREKARSWMGGGETGEPSRFSQMTGRAREAMSRPGETFQDAFERYPFAMAAGSLAAGVLLGLLIPRTRREREWIGPTGRRMRKGGQRMSERAVSTVSDKVATVAETAADAATRKFHEERQPGESVVDKAKDMFAEAREAAAEKMRQEGVTQEGIAEGVQREVEQEGRRQGLISEEKEQKKEDRPSGQQQSGGQSWERKPGQRDPLVGQAEPLAEAPEEPLDSAPIDTGTAATEATKGASVQHRSPYAAPGSTPENQARQEELNQQQPKKQDKDAARSEGFGKSPEGKKKP